MGNGRQKDRMTSDSRTRVLRAFRHEEPDRTPVFEYVLLAASIWRAVLGRLPVQGDWETAVREQGWEKAVRHLTIDYLDLADALGHDLVYVTPNPPPPVRPISATTRQKAPSSDDPAERVAARTRWQQTAYTGVNEDTLLVYRLLHDEMTLRGMDLPILAQAYAHGIWTDTDLMQTLLLAPEIAHEHFAFATRRAGDQIDCYAALGLDLIGIGGDFAGNVPLISPVCYRRFIVPELHSLSDRIHCAGKLAVNASDGNLWNVLDDFLLHSGVDGYLEIDSHAGMKLAPLKAGYGRRITFLGNLDCGNLLSFGTEEQIRQAVTECLDAGTGDGGHILTASNAITDSVPVASYLAAANAYRDYFGLPRLKPASAHQKRSGCIKNNIVDAKPAAYNRTQRTNPVHIHTTQRSVEKKERR